VNVLRDTHAALVPDGWLLDFHPISPPWPVVVANGEELGELREEEFLDALQATEAGMDQTVRAGLFEHVAARTHDIAENYGDASEPLEEWSDGWMSEDLKRRLRATTGRIRVVERLVFHLYRRR
jgi:hypothetical protein